MRKEKVIKPLLLLLFKANGEKISVAKAIDSNKY